MNRYCLAACLLGISFVASPMHAASIIKPFDVVDTNHYNAGGDNADSKHTTDNSGLDAPLPSGPIPISYPKNSVTVDSVGFDQGFAAQLAAGAPTITYTLVDPAAPAVNLTGGHFYQYSGDSPGRALKSADILVSTDGSLFTPAGTLDLSATGLNYPQPADDTQDPGMDFTFSGTGIRAVRLVNLVPFDTGTGFVGFSEIRFIGDAVPEPASLAILALGSALGLSRRPARQCGGRKA